MSEPQKKFGVGFWGTVTLATVLAALVAYPLSVGPWVYARKRWGEIWIVRVTDPAIGLAARLVMNNSTPEWIEEPFEKYLEYCQKAGRRARQARFR